MIKQTADGIQIMQLYEHHSAMVTASASLTTGSPVTLIAGDSDYGLDLIKITATTSSTVALAAGGFNVAVLNDGSTMINLPFGQQNLMDINYFMPMKQNTKNTPWVVDMDDVTGATVNITAFFIKRNK